MSKTVSLAYNRIEGGATMPNIYSVVIHPCDDTTGYWAECPDMPGCFTDGDTLQKTACNMYEAMELYIKDDHPDIGEFLLNFVVQND
jgi:predicted RNase H-like HicB family nuclease